MRRFLVAGNWKMNGSYAMSEQLVSGIVKQLQLDSPSAIDCDVLVCPSSPYLSYVGSLAENTHLYLGAQNVNANAEGAFTGEQSLTMLSDVGCQFVLLGHSERRELFLETDQIVAKKFQACVEHEKIMPILCVGETLTQRQAQQTEFVIKQQLDAVLAQVGIAGFKNAVIAYEPVWAIGTGETATPQQAQEIHCFIRKELTAHDDEIGNAIRIVYGGSVKPENAQELFSQADIDGGLIGGASLNANDFVAICRATQSIGSS